MLVLTLATNIIFAQTPVTIFGKITDPQDGQPIEYVSVVAPDYSLVVNTNEAGMFELTLPSGKSTTIQFRRTGYKPLDHVVEIPSGVTRFQLDISLPLLDSPFEVIVTAERPEEAGTIREGVEELKFLPSTTGNLESILPHIALGVTSGTGGELTSQYNVRGGNYDENLVYVNDFEIYRPLLIRSGNQEGLSFPNQDLIRDLSFSSGGFEAKYGDKMSSVLDVRYKLPEQFAASFSISLLGATAHMEGSTPIGKDPYRKWRYLVGVRYKTTEYLLGSLDVKGEYTPSFSDYQVYTTFDLSRDWQIGLMANYNRSKYDFIPESSETATGLISYTLRLTTDFEGSEQDLFQNGMSGLSLSFVPDRTKNPLFLKFLVSGYRSLEQENLDIIGQYRLSQIETDLQDPDAEAEELVILGTGTQHTYTRNVLQANVMNAEVKGGIEIQGNTGITNFLQAGMGVAYEDVEDEIHEWERLDSAGYSLPYDVDSLHLWYVLNSDRSLQGLRYATYLQNTFTRQYADGQELKLTGGIRFTYWDVNEEVIFSPRVQFIYSPKPHRSYRISSGIYAQPPFYKELRTLDGSINESILSQKSFHLLAGYSLGFGPAGTYGLKYKLIVEAYYKELWDLITYEVDNVRIRYAGDNNATGYLTGIDIRINGEIVPRAESWINLSFLRAREKINDVQHLKREEGQLEGEPVKDVPRPTDQFLTLNLFFQDYLPNNEDFRVHVTTSIGTGLPFGVKDNNVVYRNTYRYKPYHRVDIGFSYKLWSRGAERQGLGWLSFTKASWLSLEVYNILDVRNEASNTWVKTIFQAQYAIPNYLTSRRVNLKLRCEF